MNDPKLKDDILRFLIGKPHEQRRTIAEHFQIDHEQCVIILRRMFTDKYLAAFNRNPDGESYVTKLAHEARVFLNDGGYTAQGAKETKNKRKKTASEGATWIIAVVMLGIAIWQARLQDRTNKLEDKNEALQRQVDSLIKIKQ